MVRLQISNPSDDKLFLVQYLTDWATDLAMEFTFGLEAVTAIWGVNREFTTRLEGCEITR